jgi:hypothetical protein
MNLKGRFTCNLSNCFAKVLKPNKSSSVRRDDKVSVDFFIDNLIDIEKKTIIFSEYKGSIRRQLIKLWKAKGTNC